ncbi:NAD(P)/FAD-dependent oxidoreductase [Aspergillus lucknowensis]|uniref:FAD/NAD(P)-binding domain-containing protein n=1 Tax=Aspergillus lucknowensis TaxID=176173 RepID=A0ABR4LZM9_9EURO
MASDTLKMFSRGLAWFIPYLLRQGLHTFYAMYHGWTYHATSNPKHIVVIGGSFAGLELVKRLTQTIPTGYKVIWIEKNSHLNYVFAFPRFSVVQGLEGRAFIPYTGVEAGAPEGCLRKIQGVVTGVFMGEEGGKVTLQGGEEVAFEYLVLATGSTQPLPVQVSSTEREDACKELQGVQSVIEESQTIAILGGGAVGVELASDIKDFYQDKEVTLVHSRDQLLNRFGPRLQDHTLTALRNELGVRVLLGERPRLPSGGESSMTRNARLVFKDGREEAFDLVIGCTGQRPNSSILATAYPGSLCGKSSRILVQPTLQILTNNTITAFPATTHPTPNRSERVFALGDVAAHPGPLMARAGVVQSEIVVQNILSLINGQPAKKIYKPNWFIEGAIKLTLGKTHYAIYARDGGEKETGDEVMIVSKKGKVDLDVGMAWRQYGVGKEFAKAKRGDVGLSA